MFERLSKLFQNRDGATAIEYGLIAAFIAIACVAAVATVGTSVSSTFSTVAGKF